MLTVPARVSRRHSRMLALAAAAGWSSSRSSSPGARRDIARRFQVGSTAHDRHRSVATLQCSSPLPLLIHRLRVYSLNDQIPVPAHDPGDGNHAPFTAPTSCPTTISSGRLYPAITTPTSQPLPRGPQIPIAPARRTVVPRPARGFLPPGLSDACPRSAQHCRVTGRHLITLNESGLSRQLFALKILHLLGTALH